MTTNGTTDSEPRDDVADAQDSGPSRAEQAKLMWAALPTRTKVQMLVGLGLSLLGAATAVRLGGRLVRVGYRRVRR